MEGVSLREAVIMVVVKEEVIEVDEVIGEVEVVDFVIIPLKTNAGNHELEITLMMNGQLSPMNKSSESETYVITFVNRTIIKMETVIATMEFGIY